ncbi:hypothetical protein IX51_04615 [uncultured archaeon]|nr:hypothetical protein IX51_04615 [uncultured archaeon]HKJ97044.1 hypothetical protein [Thermoplasmataceae archaeon]
MRKGGVEAYMKEEEKENVRKFELLLGNELLTDHELSHGKRSEKMKPGDRSKSGQVLEDVFKTKEKLI